MMIAGAIICSLIFLGVAFSTIKSPKIPIPEWMHHVTLDFSTTPILGVMILLMTQIVSLSDLWQSLIGDDNIRPLEIIVLFFSLAYVCLSLDSCGIYTWLAIKAVGITKGKESRLFFCFFVLSSILTIFTSNDIVILTVTPVIAYITKFTKMNPVPHLFAQFFASNILSISLYIGNPTNIIVGEAFRIGFLQYSGWMMLPAWTSGITCITVLWIVFRKDLEGQVQIPNITIPIRRYEAIYGILCLFLCLILLAASNWIHISIWIITASFAGLMFIKDLISDGIAIRTYHRKLNEEKIEASYRERDRTDENHFSTVSLEDVDSTTDLQMEEMVDGEPVNGDVPTNGSNSDQPSTPEDFGIAPRIPRWTHGQTAVSIRRLPWKIVPFVIGMFVMVHSLALVGLIPIFAQGLAFLINAFNANILTILFVTYLSAILCNILNNQPMTILMTSILLDPQIAQTISLEERNLAMYSIIMGSNYGANITLIGALAGIMWNTILHDRNIEITYLQFLKTGCKVTPVVIAVGCFVFWIESTVISIE
eukprot:TRINITY_DN14944_c0_g1_i1.p1 TRINITY_DN14944_c0_g1~~TRINITY_DN14944_c0_g1_i1.p1  ORF type:complete len:537 (-),score=97.99 TRINITY_DN14944_c0_g1_i1:39-1649(-)